MEELSRILYVEDEPDIQQVASLALEMVGGFTLKTCSSGQEALDVIADYKPQMLLLDVMMPDMDGPTTLANIRELEPFRTIPAVFMTAKVQPSEVKSLLNMGALDVIAKPFDPMLLATQVNEIWQRMGA